MIIKKGYLIAGIAVVAILVIGLGVSFSRSGNGEKSSVENTPEINKTDAAAQSVQKTVSSYLKSPGSAQFINVISREEVNQPDSFIVFGDVDSQNSFGALMRSHFFVELGYTGGSLGDVSSWKIETLDLAGINYISSGNLQDPPLQLDEQALETTGKFEDLYRNFK